MRFGFLEFPKRERDALLIRPSHLVASDGSDGSNMNGDGGGWSALTIALAFSFTPLSLYYRCKMIGETTRKQHPEGGESGR